MTKSTSTHDSHHLWSGEAPRFVGGFGGNRRSSSSSSFVIVASSLLLTFGRRDCFAFHHHHHHHHRHHHHHSRNDISNYHSTRRGSEGRCCPILPLPSHVSTSTSSRRRRRHLAATTALSAHVDPTDVSGRTYDLAIIGAGPVGVSSALLASSSHGANVILVDSPRASGALINENTGEDLSLGGPTGLFSKALRASVKRINVGSLRGMGLRDDSVWNEVVASCVELASFNARDALRQLEYAGVTYVKGHAAFADSGGPSSLIITPEGSGIRGGVGVGTGGIVTLNANRVLIATGSTPFRPGGIPFDGKRIFDSDSINTLSKLPKSVVITGSGIIAIEYAKIFKNLGSDVTLIIRDSIPRNALMKIGLDKDIAGMLVADLARSGIKVERGAQVKKFHVPRDNDKAPIVLELEGRNGGDRPSGSATTIKCDIYLAAVGRKPNTANLNLAAAGIRTDEFGGIVVDSRLRSTARGGNVYAAGDVLGRPFLASTGTAQGFQAVQGMFETEEERLSDALEIGGEGNDADDKKEDEHHPSSYEDRYDPKNLASNPFAFPIGVWTSPEAAYYGLSTQQCRDMGINAGEGIALYAECLRGLVFSPNGLLKLVFDKDNGQIMGVHICGDDACELIHYGMELVKAERTIDDVLGNIYSAVTFHEMYRIAAMAAVDEAGARKRRAAAGRALTARNSGISQD